MSDPEPISAFARRCWELVIAMTDKNLSPRDQDEARRELSRLIRQNVEGDRESFDVKAAQAGRDD